MQICANCFNDIEIQQFISINGIEGYCPYCATGLVSKLIEFSELSDFFSEFINLFKTSKDGEPLEQVIQNDWSLFSNNVNITKLLTDILDSINSEIKSSNQVDIYQDEILECTRYWESFKDGIKWETRFLINIEKLEELHWNQLFKRTIIFNPPVQLFRARLHQNDNQHVFKCDEMGSPEREKVSAGRANPKGIPYLYLSKNIETTLYEVRSLYLDEISVGTFDIRDNCILKLVDFTESTSIFEDNDNDLKEYVKSVLLKRYISKDLSKPIRRYDSELEYIPTQFICEYIKYLYQVDGIMFDSSLSNGGKNIVLFSQNKVVCTDVSKYLINNVSILSKIVD